MKRQTLLKIINEVEQKSHFLSPEFGKNINNPLLKDMNLALLVQNSIKNHVFKSWRYWDTSVTSGRVKKGDKQLFRAALVYVNNTLHECIEGGNSKQDHDIALAMMKDLEEVLSILDSTNLSGE